MYQVFFKYMVGQVKNKNAAFFAKHKPYALGLISNWKFLKVERTTEIFLIKYIVNKI